MQCVCYLCRPVSKDETHNVVGWLVRKTRRANAQQTFDTSTPVVSNNVGLQSPHCNPNTYYSFMFRLDVEVANCSLITDAGTVGWLTGSVIS